MKKKFLLVLLFSILFLSVSVCSFAMDNLANGARNMVDSTKNTLDNIGNGMENGIKSGMNTIKDGTENVVNDVRGGMQDTENTMAGMMTRDNNGNSGNNDGYDVARTSSNEITVAGMSTNTWTWIIVALAATAIIILVWSYIRQKNKNDIYIDSDEL